MKEILNLNIKKLNWLNILYLNIFLIILVSILSLFYSNLYLEKFPDFIDSDNQIILKKFKFDYGELLHNLYYNGEYKQVKFDTLFYLLRLPLLPIYNYFLLKISLNFYFFFIFKNVIIFFLLNLCILFFLNKFDLKIKHYLIFLFIFFYNPYNLHVLLIIDFADSLNAFLISMFFLMMIINSKKSILIGGLIIFCLYLSKSFLFLLCLCYPIFNLIFNLIFKQNKFTYFKFTILFSAALLATLSWGIFGKVNSNYFPFGSNLSSYNSFALTSMLNKNFKNYYPERSVDLLLDNEIFDKKKFENEKEFYDYFNTKNKIYLKQNFKEYINDFKIKIHFIFFSLVKDGGRIDNNKELRLSNLFNKPILIISIIFSLYLFYKQKDILSFQYLTIVFLYLLPLIIGWATTKHLVPIFLISKIYLFLIYVKKNKNSISF